MIPFRLFVMILAISALPSCSTPAEVFKINSTREYNVSKDVLWERVIRQFATTNTQVKTIEKVSGIIFAERAMTSAEPTNWAQRGKIGEFADCGKEFMLVPYRQAVEFNIFVREMGPRASSGQLNPYPAAVK